APQNGQTVLPRNVSCTWRAGDDSSWKLWKSLGESMVRLMVLPRFLAVLPLPIQSDVPADGKVHHEIRALLVNGRSCLTAQPASVARFYIMGKRWAASRRPAGFHAGQRPIRRRPMRRSASCREWRESSCIPSAGEPECPFLSQTRHTPRRRGESLPSSTSLNGTFPPGGQRPNPADAYWGSDWARA